MTSTSNPGGSGASPSPSAAGFCAACGAALAVGARFCHRCGTPFGEGAPLAAGAGGSSRGASMLPWGVAFVAMIALVAYFAGQNFGEAKGSAVDGSSNSLATSAIDGQGAAPPATGAPEGAPPLNAQGMPDLNKMSPQESASRLYIRAMTAAENGQADTLVSFFATMAVAAHGMIEKMTIDERYHMGRVAELAKDLPTMRAQADTILSEQQSNLLGLVLAARAARAAGDAASERTYSRLLVQVADKELARANEDYQQHRTEIDRAVAEAKNLK